MADPAAPGFELRQRARRTLSLRFNFSPRLSLILRQRDPATVNCTCASRAQLLLVAAI
jgi:hypothetical protein